MFRTCCLSTSFHIFAYCCSITIFPCLSKDQVVSAVLENCHDQPKESNYPRNSDQDSQNNEVQEQNVMTRAVSWRKIVNEKDYSTM